jgi:cytochrome c-type biogenesis protein CcmH/NrfF
VAIYLPLAHATHWLWVLYLPPVLIVIGATLRVTLAERRKKRD